MTKKHNAAMMQVRKSGGNTVSEVKNAKIEDIQLLRAAAILLVLFAHLSLPSTITNALGIANPGWIGVELFFVISGFVVTKSLDRSAWAVTPFAIRRFFRLYPILVVFSITTFVMVLIAQRITPDYGQYLFVVPTDRFLGQITDIFLWTFPTPQNGSSYTSSAMWSLPREFRFYAFFALTICLLKLAFPRKPAATRSIVMLVAMTVAILGIGSRILSYVSDMPGWLIWIQEWFLDLMSLGVLAALIPDRVRLKIGVMARPFAALFILLPVIWLCFVSSPLAPSKLTQPSIGICALFFVLLVIVAADCGFGPRIPRWVRNLGSIVGDRSYSLYVFHYPIMMMNWYLGLFISTRIISGNWFWPMNQLIMFVLTAPLIIEILYRGVELPWIARGKTFLRNHAPMPNQSTSTARGLTFQSRASRATTPSAKRSAARSGTNA